ncbi:bifunctional DNA primase/polymerase [Mesorhizobium sp. BR1-1-7]|uniref:bifunctional DNA primase/polymerase n=1 Tax=Mesorhizobium sp. BR1-1-7 TaxID=2876647 RepID=UPI001CCE49FB|nr:bifunctional DNA primase/polymerase [Mesorhizobium sp. BR1-1-7]MBZ9921479.1 bifunctional DNA primase/polymerase [Mesorhizobium sp. BR1-1-7]
MTSLETARWYTTHGVSVFPCHESEAEEVDPATGEIITRPEKSPYTTNGLKGATRSTRIVDIFFGEKYPSAAIGVPTGEPLGAWVLDLDTHDGKDGHVWLAEMEAKHGPLPDTARASTANGGTHIFFRHVDGVRNRAAIAPGVDTRGDGGYILAPGSRMADGRAYRWLNHDDHGLPPFAEAPQWLLDLVVSKPAAAEQHTEYVYRPASGGFDDRTSHAEISELLTFISPDCGYSDWVSVLMAIHSALGADGLALADEWSSKGKTYRRGEVARKWKGFKSGGINLGSLCDLARQGGADLAAISRHHKQHLENAPSSDPSDMVASYDAKKAAPKAVSEKPIQTSDTTTTPPKKRERFDKIWFDEIEEGAPKETLIKGLLGVGEYTTISGLPGTGKSVIVTDLACHVAAGMDWHGRKLKKRGLVIYVAAERKKLTERRMMAFRKHHGVKDVPLLVVGGRLDFTRNLEDARALIALIKEAETETGLPCVWVIIDTLTRVFGAGDQNASKDMTKFVQSCDEILVATHAHVTAIHHSSWSGERGKGAIDLDGAVDASYMVKKEHGKYRLVCDGTNDGDEGDILAFKMESIELSQDEDGEPTTAPVVVKLEPDTVPTSGTLKGYKGEVLTALTVAIDKDGIEPEGDAFPEEINVVDLDTWKKHFYASRDMESVSVAATTKKQFQRAPEDLVKAGHVNRIGLWYWAA